MKQKVVVIGHGYTSRLGVIRALGHCGYEVIVVVITSYRRDGKTLNTTKPIDCYSKYLSEVYYCLRDSEQLLQLLRGKCTDKNQKVIIIPDSDFSAAVIDLNQEQLRDHFLFPHINHEKGAVVHWMDKVRQKELAQAIGLNVVKADVIEIENRHYTIPYSIQYPCFTKPLVTIEGGKRFLRRCSNESELHSILELASCYGDIKVLVEEFKEIGTEYAVLGFSNGAEVVIPGIIQIIQMAHGGHYGVACKGKIIPVDGFESIVDQFKQFVLHVGYVGLFDIDFYESDGVLYFGEMNLRFGGSGYAVTAKGVNLPAMLVRTLRNETIEDMNKCITGSAVYVNERMCMDDWYLGFMTTQEFNKIIESSDISFVRDKDDRVPNVAFLMEYHKRLMKRIILRILRKLNLR